jgi:hypothetical protein
MGAYKKVNMITKQDVLDCYFFLLDRSPENEQVIEEKCQAHSLEDLVADMVTSTEFLEAHKVALARQLLSSKP